MCFANKEKKKCEYYNNLMDTNDIEKFSFEPKYANQEKNLLKLYGKARTMANSIKIIVVTDTHNGLDEEKFKEFIQIHNSYDVCLLLGDYGRTEVEKLLKYVDQSKTYCLLGNHDYDYIEQYNLNNLNGKVININGVKILGIQGSFRYKPVDFPSFSQKESIEFLNDKEQVDILVSHDMGFDSTAINNPSHQGLFGITYYLFKNRVPYHIHGHIHDPYRKDMINGTHEISSYMFEYIEIK